MHVDFYLLPADASVLTSACVVLEKIYLEGHRIFVWCPSQVTAHALDELLWTFKEESFIPHHLQGEGPTPGPAIQIAYQNPPQGFHDVLFNLTPKITEFTSQFRRVVELVSPDEDAKIKSREHYRWYKQQGATLSTWPLEVSPNASAK